MGAIVAGGDAVTEAETPGGEAAVDGAGADEPVPAAEQAAVPTASSAMIRYRRPISDPLGRPERQRDGRESVVVMDALPATR